MKKTICFLIIFSALALGCSGGDNAGDNEEYTNTDYYYESGNQFITNGHAKMKEQDYKGAVEEFSKAVEEMGDYAFAYGFRGWAKYNAGDFEGALADLNKAIELKNDISDFYGWRAEVYRELGEINAMNADFEKEKELVGK